MPKPRRETAQEQDMTAFSESKPSRAQYMQHAFLQCRRNPLSMAAEFRRLAKGGRLDWSEYVQLAVYDPAHSDDERGRFVSESLHWPITRACCDMSWQAATEDKWLCTFLVARAGLPVAPILAVVDTTDRSFPGTQVVRTPKQFCDFALTNRDELPVFCKPNRGVASFGTFLVTDAEPARLHVEGHGWMSYEACLHEFIGADSYLLQAEQRNHTFLEDFTNRLATVRVYLLRTADGVRFPWATLKMASGENLADNFWRPGNVACDIDPSNGAVRTARTKSLFGTTDHTNHPVNGAPLVGRILPTWESVLGLARDCSSIFSPVRYQSMDIAIGPQGPLLIEVNTGGAFNLPQLASGRGFLTNEVLEFLCACGWQAG